MRTPFKQGQGQSMKQCNCDVVVVGAGHNTLTVAAVPAKCGLGVLGWYDVVNTGMSIEIDGFGP
jgi:ribulose 1,5-bisphosphate synthetase/thiazole synthase